jgi:UDP-glucose 4-epimerase
MNQTAESSYRGKKVMVTGAFGFIGSHLVGRLIDDGAQVVATGPAGWPGGSSDAEFLELDVREGEAVDRLIGKARPDVIFNLAGKVGGDRSSSAYFEHIDVTVTGSLNLANSALKHEVSSFVQMGSSEEYGEGPVPFKESQRAKPVSPYSACKVSATECLLAAWRSFGLPVVVVRPTVVYGPGQKPRMLVPHLFDRYLNGEVASLSPGDQTRDFLFVDDAVKGITAAGLRSDLAGQIFNLCSAEEISVKDLAAKVAALCQFEGELGLGRMDYREPTIMRHRACPEKARELLGFSAHVDMDRGLRETMVWWKSKLD